MPNKNNTMVTVPRELTAENGAKAVLIDEFKIDVPMTCSACDFHGAQSDCEVCGGEVNYTQSVTVPWDSIKEIYRAAINHFHPQPGLERTQESGHQKPRRAP